MTLVAPSSPYGPYLSKEALKLPWIRCLFCNYQDKKEFDLSLHVLEKHKDKLLEIPISSRDRKTTKSLLEPRARLYSKFESAIEFRLDVAVEMSKEENRNLGVKHAILQIQKRIIKRQHTDVRRDVRRVDSRSYTSTEMDTL